VKKLFLLPGLLISLQVSSQLSFQQDTVKINEVIISKKQVGTELPGFKKTIIDSLSLDKGALTSVADLLSQNTPVFMKSYGGGGTATASFRGTGAGHTQVTWNGISINDPMLGQTDFSLIPAGMADEIQVHFGAASMELGNGGLGGTINLQSNTDWKKQTSVRVVPSAGSFGRFSELILIKTGNENLYSTTKAYFQTMDNDFPFLNKTSGEGIIEKRKDNQVSQKGFMQEVSLRQNDNLISARIWYHAASRNLPGPISMLGIKTGEKQADESIRSMLSLSNNKSLVKYFAAASWMMTELDYEFPLYSIISNNLSNSVVLKGGLTTYLDNDTRLGLTFNNELNAIKSNNYETNIVRNSASLTFSAIRKTRDRFGGEILIRETMDGNSLLIPDFSAGIEYRIKRNKEQFLEMNISRNSKIPSLNDLYWFPGGNHDLKNEYSWSGEIGYKAGFNFSDKIAFSSDLNLYSNFIRDMIQWRPVEGSSYWITDNIRSVNTSGIEANINAKYSSDDFNVNLITGYAYTRATDRDPDLEGNQLIYVPSNMVNGSLRLGYEKIYSILETRYTGRLYTDTNNSAFLPGYATNNIIGGYRINSGNHLIDFSLKIENLFNVSYQTIADYPQPGRAYYFTISFRLCD
jgi:outer membrane cobalamin receptor